MRSHGSDLSRWWPTVLAWFLLTTFAGHAATITWTGRAGTKLWNQPGNWSGGAVPGRADDVVIPQRTGPVEIREGTVTILRITAPDGLHLLGGTLTLTEGQSRVGGTFTLEAAATLVGIGAKTILIAEGSPAQWSGKVVADDGAVLRLMHVTSIRSEGMAWRADDPDSLIDASAVTEISLTTAGYFDLEATRAGRIDLGGIRALRGPVRATSSTGGVIDLSGIRGRWTSEGFTYRQGLTARDGGIILVPGLTEFDVGTLDIDTLDALPTRQLTTLTRSQITVRGISPVLEGVTNIDASDLTALDGAVVRFPRVGQLRAGGQTWRARGVKSVIDVGAAKELLISSGTYMDLEARTEARIELGGLTSLQGPLRATATGGGVVNLGGLRGRWTSQGYTYQQALHASEGGIIQIPGITEFDRGTLDTDSLEGIPTAQLVAITRSSLHLRRVRGAFDQLSKVDNTDLSVVEGAVLQLPRVTTMNAEALTWRVQDPVSLIDARSLTDVVFSTGGYFEVIANTEGRVDLSGLSQIRGPLQVTAGARGVVDLSGVRGRWTSEGFTYHQSLTTSKGGLIRISGLTEFDRGTIDIESADSIDAEKLTVLTRSSVVLRGADDPWSALTNVDDSHLSVLNGGRLRLTHVPRVRSVGATWRAQGPGSLIDAADVSEITFPRSGYLQVEALTAGRIDLSGLTALTGPLQVTAQSGGIVDLSGVKGGWSSDGFTYSQSLNVVGGGAVLLPRVTEFDRGQIFIGDGGSLPTEQFTRITDSTVTIDTARVSFRRLREQTGTRFDLRNGGLALFADAPRIVTHPNSVETRAGENVELFVVAEGASPLIYQWRKNGQNLRSQRGARLFLDNVDANAAGAYTVVVLNGAGSIESEPATVKLTLPSLPFTDAFATRGRITSASGAGTGNSSQATAENGEPRHASKRGGRSLWLTWKPTGSGRAAISTRGSAFDTLLAVYVGDTLGGLIEVASDEDSDGFLNGAVQFSAVQDTEYHIAVDGFAGAGGDIILTWDLLAGALALPRIVAGPVGGTVRAGAEFTLKVEVQGNGILYQWFLNGQAVPNASESVLTLRGITPAQAGNYTVQVTMPNGQPMTTPGALVEVASRSDEARARDKLEDLYDAPAPGAPTLHAGGSSGFTSVFPGIPGTRDTANTGAQQSPDDPVILGELGGASIWLGFVAVTNGWIRLFTEGSEIPTVLGVFTNRTSLQPVALAVPEPPAKFSEVIFGAYAGVEYLVMIDGVDGAMGGIRLTYSIELAPVELAKLGFVGSTFLIQIPVPPGEYEISTADHPAAWTLSYTTNITGGLLQHLDTDTVGHPRRFYRINGVP